MNHLIGAALALTVLLSASRWLLAGLNRRQAEKQRTRLDRLRVVVKLPYGA